jgi:hypothetical protein
MHHRPQRLREYADKLPPAEFELLALLTSIQLA